MTSDDSKHPRYESLMRGARAVLTEHGLEGFTTGRIARQAGIGQSAFYNYFASRDVCLAALADEVGQEILGILRKTRANEAETGLVSSFAASLRVLTVDHRQTVELFLRFRRDAGLLGQTFRALQAQAIEELRRHMIESGYVEDNPQGRRLTHLTVGSVLGAVEAILDGRLDDIDAVANDFGHLAMAAVSFRMNS